MSDVVDYGPLQGLIGVWKGDKGVDLSPEPEGKERSPYYETMTFSPAGDLDNAETEELVALHYHQIVARKSNDKVFHNQTGYWMWNAATGVVMHSLAIPRGVCVLACGEVTSKEDGALQFELSTEGDFTAITESPFMREKARTKAFSISMTLNGDSLRYKQSILLDIYGREFDHTDVDTLQRSA
ncbi:MAG: heme-binding beta-barrel domain-containing protein [Oceanococcus sp.]